MAQRVSLVTVPVSELRAWARVVTGQDPDAAGLAARLVRDRQGHVTRWTVSRRVIAAVRDDEALRDSHHFGFASNCLPYLLGSPALSEVADTLEALETETDEARLEELFVEEAKKLGAQAPHMLDRETYRVPSSSVAQGWLVEQLAASRSVHARRGAARASDDDDDPAAVYAVQVWQRIAYAYARLEPRFWQGRNRWLGSAAYPAAVLSDVQTTLLSLGVPSEPTLWDRVRDFFGLAPARPPLTPDLAQLVAMTQARTRSQMAQVCVDGLAGLLVSVARLEPELAMEALEEHVPPEGGGYCATGGVTHARLDELDGVMTRLLEDGPEVYGDGTSEWAVLVKLAAWHAGRREAHLVEGDDVDPGDDLFQPL